MVGWLCHIQMQKTAQGNWEYDIAWDFDNCRDNLLNGRLGENYETHLLKCSITSNKIAEKLGFLTISFDYITDGYHFF